MAAREDGTGGGMMRMAIAASLACLAIGTQLLLTPVVAVDSYQLFLGAVAVSSLYGGARAGLLTFAISCLGKFYFFMPADILAVDSGLALQTLIFLGVAGLICWIGGRFHASELGLAAVLTGIADAVVATDQSGRIKFMNPAAEALSGCRHAAAVKRNITEVIHLRTAGGAPVELRVDPNTRPLFTRIDANTVLDSKAGCAIPIAGSVGTITDEAGIVSGSVIVLRDITERLRAEQERERLLQDLQSALARVKVLSGMLPICAGCKNIRNERGDWLELETYIRDHSEAQFSQGLCPECVKRYYPEIENDARRASAGASMTGRDQHDE